MAPGSREHHLRQSLPKIPPLVPPPLPLPASGIDLSSDLPLLDPLELSDRGAPPAPHYPMAEPIPLAEMLDDGPRERDRIVVLGRRQSGKTIFLASIYHKLWKSVDGLTAKALSGEIHRQLITTWKMLERGEWPSSTLGTSQIDLELEYHGKKRLLVALDFAGELFSKAFVDEQSDWPGVKELVNHIDQAAAVLLLVDPSVVAGMDAQAAMDDDFGLVQAVQRIRNWPGGDGVPIVLVFTKSDQTESLMDAAGGPLEFARKHFKALLRVLKELPIIQISAIQTEIDPLTKQRRPRKEFTPINLDNPLRYCLCALEKTEEKAENRRMEDERRILAARSMQQRQEEAFRERRSVKRLAAIIAAVGSVMVGLILYFRI